MTTESTVSSVEILNFVIDRQNASKTTSVQQVMKKFELPFDDVVEHLSEFPGYTIQFSEDPITAKAKIDVYAAEEPEVEPEAEEVTEEAVQPEIADAPEASDAKPTPKPRKKPGKEQVYPNYTADEAAALSPDGYTTLKDLYSAFRAAGVPPSRMIKAMGGDRLAAPPLAEYWTPFTIDGKKLRYLPKQTEQDIERFRDTAYFKSLWKTEESAETAPETSEATTEES